MRSYLVVVISILCAATLAGCSGEAGSGTAQTLQFEFGEVDRLSVGSTFRVDVEIVDGPASAQVVVDDNLADSLDVRVSDGVLHVEFGPDNVDPSVDPTALVKLPALTELRVSGASDVIVADEVVTSALTVDASGASELEIPMDASTVTLDVTGASTVTLIGSAETTAVEGSGASTLDFAQLQTGSAEVDLSGAVTLELYAVDFVRGRLTGASTLETGPDTVVDVETSGGSSVERD